MYLNLTNRWVSNQKIDTNRLKQVEVNELVQLMKGLWINNTNVFIM